MTTRNPYDEAAQKLREMQLELLDGRQYERTTHFYGDGCDAEHGQEPAEVVVHDSTISSE